jgi:hypothetical protein
MARLSEGEERWPVVAVVDGQGGGIGGAIIKGLREQVGEHVEILALGTNAAATTTMMRAGANRGATGENAIARSVDEADLIAGNVVIEWLLPLAIPGVELMGVDKKPLPHLIKLLSETLVSRRCEFCAGRRMVRGRSSGDDPTETGGGYV